MLKYPIPKDKRIALTKLYFHIATAPGMPTHIVSTCSDHLYSWTRSKKKMSIDDLRLPWLPIYKILSKDLFLARRQYEIRYVACHAVTRPLRLISYASQTSWYMGFIAETLRRFFHPAAADDMLQTFVPLINPSSLSVSPALNFRKRD